MSNDETITTGATLKARYYAVRDSIVEELCNEVAERDAIIAQLRSDIAERKECANEVAAQLKAYKADHEQYVAYLMEESTNFALKRYDDGKADGAREVIKDTIAFLQYRLESLAADEGDEGDEGDEPPTPPAEPAEPAEAPLPTEEATGTVKPVIGGVGFVPGSILLGSGVPLSGAFMATVTGNHYPPLKITSTLPANWLEEAMNEAMKASAREGIKALTSGTPWPVTPTPTATPPKPTLDKAEQRLRDALRQRVATLDNENRSLRYEVQRLRSDMQRRDEISAKVSLLKWDIWKRRHEGNKDNT